MAESEHASSPAAARDRRAAGLAKLAGAGALLGLGFWGGISAGVDLAEDLSTGRLVVAFTNQRADRVFFDLSRQFECPVAYDPVLTEPVTAPAREYRLDELLALICRQAGCEVKKVRGRGYLITAAGGRVETKEEALLSRLERANDVLTVRVEWLRWELSDCRAGR